jgi:HlyD family secretion protein
MATAVEDAVRAEPVAPASVFVPPPAVSRTPAHKWMRWALAAGLLLAVAVGLVVWRAQVRAAISYETVPVERGPIQASVTATGTLNAVVSVQVGSQVSGNIKALYADYNTKVKKGQLVALIDPAIFQAQVDQVHAALGSAHNAAITAEAQVAKANADLSTAIANEKSADSILSKDQANAINAKNQWQRADRLFGEGIVSAQDHDSARAASDAAEAQVTADQAQVEASRHNIQSAQAQVRLAEAQRGSAQAQERQAQAALDQAQINLEHTRITAPVDGTVIARNMDVGQTIAASFQVTPLFNIAQDLTKMQVDTNVDESDIGSVVTGQAATFTVDAYPGTAFHGQVTDVRKAPITQQNVVTYDVVIGVANPDLRLFPGMTANVTILTVGVNDTLKIPNAVLRLRPAAAVLKQAGLPAPQTGKQEVYVMRNGKPRPVAVTLGVSDGKYTAVAATDLRAGDQVVVRFVTTASSTATSSGPTGSMPRGPRF